MSRTGLAADRQVTGHETPVGHPEQPARFDAVMHGLASNGLIEYLDRLPERIATDDELALVHTREYIALVEREVGQGRKKLSTGDTEIARGSLAAARHAAGAALAATEAVLSGAVGNAFCVVRPPGHHASADIGMGFCVFNNVAVAARYAQKRFGAERLLIADWDVHHGNGTQDIFYSDDSVLFFSTHQSPWYPGTGAASERGAGDAEGFTINCPFAAGAGRREILGAFREILLPAAEEFQPDLVLISAGFDSRIDDPLGRFTLADEDFGELTRMLLDFAERTCAGKVVSVLEGGYNLRGLESAAVAHVRALLGRDC